MWRTGSSACRAFLFAIAAAVNPPTAGIAGRIRAGGPATIGAEQLQVHGVLLFKAAMRSASVPERAARGAVCEVGAPAENLVGLTGKHASMGGAPTDGTSVGQRRLGSGRCCRRARRGDGRDFNRLRGGHSKRTQGEADSLPVA